MEICLYLLVNIILSIKICLGFKKKSFKISENVLCTYKACKKILKSLAFKELISVVFCYHKKLV